LWIRYIPLGRSDGMSSLTRSVHGSLVSLSALSFDLFHNIRALFATSRRTAFGGLITTFPAIPEVLLAHMFQKSHDVPAHLFRDKEGGTAGIEVHIVLQFEHLRQLERETQ
jgi:hypothetical protein